MTDEVKKIVKVPTSITVKKFSELLALPVSQVITELLKNNILATINEEIDFDTATIIAQDLGFETEADLVVLDSETITVEKLIEICKKEKESGKNLRSRPAVVTILGHVDHGKTTLLDTIRKASVAAKEAGGITQHISAYQVKKKGQLITFIDTPGHEAFSGMRERGVSIADIAVLVVAADDGVRPQTKEVIEYLKEKKIPTVVAINKIDKPDANPQRVKQELADNGIIIEQWGGDVMAAEISAKQNIGIDDLLENILLVAEVEDFKADDKRDGFAIVLESNLDPQKGPVATILVKTGTLKVGQDVTAGTAYGRIRKIEDFTGRNLLTAGPSTPVTLMGLNSTPNTNDVLQVVSGKSIARLKSKEFSGGLIERKEKVTSQKLMRIMEEDKIQKLNIVLKADVQGSLEAIEQIISTIKTDEVIINIVESEVGNITESDVKVSAPSQAVIFGFNVETTPVAKRLAEGSEVKIKTFKIIYELVEEVKKMVIDMLPPEIVRTDLGMVNVLAIFKTGKRDMIVGGRVTDGKITKGAQIEIRRDGEIIGKGKLEQLQQDKKVTAEVGKGNECGIVFEGDTKIKAGDTLLAFTEEEKKRTL
ncbi:MAG: Translation initiation factor IF-2 [Candidatus Moranbacteria bacterium GW2011_GWC2_37_73]|nr:MAG: Translation initiation factor IF-2 [Parcubacteria group bacterium GW2011_GWC1_36_108]KKQ01101.1 MAG: Translation initiation factor IF-2 [Candidatus Moranbacteria bacterium GW2011_GWD1_36_198]KKQ01341.1 MAG: Translation initiation factor IF-2 [Candidatus Moranbacteria bacterium GW2011_GWD2_36_198]KKQ40163.1 MAG: Translation initiation factor IF-2 [Candidatus Moranbacteria bacterium GW2011_GWC2_37_73]HAS00052.1 translation initiation factor IF-2 [Candidatus Moranbacteria bacterium]